MHDIVPSSNPPTVSVLMGVYNEADSIVATLDSVFAQTVTDLECIVVDDGSTDDTAAAVLRYREKEPRLRLARMDAHGGLTRALHRGVNECRGTWMARIDSGDTWAPDKLARQLAHGEIHPEVGLIGCATEDHNLQTEKRTTRHMPKTDEAIRKALWHQCPFIHPTILARLELVRSCGNYDPAYTCSQDYELYWRLLFVTKGYNLPDVLAYRPTHGSASISFTRWKEQVRCTLRIRWRYYRFHGASLAQYASLLPLAGKLLLPTSLKQWKQRLGRRLR